MKLIITIDNTAIVLQTDSADGAAEREVYNLNSGISIAANLRQALSVCALLRNPRLYDRVTVVVDTPTMLIPEDEYTSGSATLLYRNAFSMLPADEVQTSPLDTLGVVLAFAVNKDLHFVLNENFRYVCFASCLHTHCAEPACVWWFPGEAVLRVQRQGYGDNSVPQTSSALLQLVSYRRHTGCCVLHHERVAATCHAPHRHTRRHW